MWKAFLALALLCLPSFGGSFYKRESCEVRKFIDDVWDGLKKNDRTMDDAFQTMRRFYNRFTVQQCLTYSLLDHAKNGEEYLVDGIHYALLQMWDKHLDPTGTAVFTQQGMLLSYYFINHPESGQVKARLLSVEACRTPAVCEERMKFPFSTEATLYESFRTDGVAREAVRKLMYDFIDEEEMIRRAYDTMKARFNIAEASMHGVSGVLSAKGELANGAHEAVLQHKVHYYDSATKQTFLGLHYGVRIAFEYNANAGTAQKNVKINNVRVCKTVDSCRALMPR